MSSLLALFLALLILAAIGALLVGMIVIPMRLIQKSWVKNQTRAQIELMKAKQEMERQKTNSWKCACCGAVNYNRDTCEYCDSGKPPEEGKEASFDGISTGLDAMNKHLRLDVHSNTIRINGVDVDPASREASEVLKKVENIVSDTFQNINKHP